MRIGLRYAARSDTGMLQSVMTDVGYAGPYLLAVAVDEGVISPEESTTHPQRLGLLRVLDGRGEAPDSSLRETVADDRYLLCSGGLSRVISAETIHQVLTMTAENGRGAAAGTLVDLAVRAGGPHNITCIVADAVDLGWCEEPRAKRRRRSGSWLSQLIGPTRYEREPSVSPSSHAPVWWVLARRQPTPQNWPSNGPKYRFLIPLPRRAPCRREGDPAVRRRRPRIPGTVRP